MFLLIYLRVRTLTVGVGSYTFSYFAKKLVQTAGAAVPRSRWLDTLHSTYTSR